MAADPLYRRKVDASLYEPGNGRVTHRMRGDEFGIEPGACHGIPRRAVHTGTVPGSTIRMWRREDPCLAGLAHFALTPKQICQLQSNRLFTLARFGIGDK